MSRARDRLLLFLFVSAVIHITVLYSPWGLPTLSPPAPHTTLEIALEAAPSSPAAATTIVLTGPAPTQPLKPAAKALADTERAYRLERDPTDQAAAAYLSDWIDHAERRSAHLLTQRPPRPQASGQKVVAVHIDRSGRVLAIDGLSGKQQTALAHELRDLIEQAAPYPPIPDAVAPGQNRIVVTRTWALRGLSSAPR